MAAADQVPRAVASWRWAGIGGGCVGRADFRLHGTQGLDELPRGRRQRSIAKVQDTVGRPQDRRIAVERDEAPCRQVVGEDPGRAREDRVAALRDQPGDGERVHEDLRDEVRDGGIVRICRGAPGGCGRGLASAQPRAHERELERPREREPTLLRQRVTGPAGQEHAQRGKGLDHEPGIVLQPGHPGDAHVDPLGQHVPDDLERIGGRAPDSQARMGARDAGDGPRDGDLGGIRAGSDRERPLLQPGEELDLPAQVGFAPEHGFAPFEQDATKGRGYHALAGSIEEPHPERALERGDPAGDARLRDA